MGCCQHVGATFYRQMPSTSSRHRVPQEYASDIFPPPDCSSKLQPLDPGVIHSLKAKYRTVLVHKAIAAIQNNTELELNILQAMHIVVAVWNSRGSAAVRNCFRKAGSLVIKTLRKIMRRLQQKTGGSQFQTQQLSPQIL